MSFARTELRRRILMRQRIGYRRRRNCGLPDGEFIADKSFSFRSSAPFPLRSR